MEPKSSCHGLKMIGVQHQHEPETDVQPTHAAERLLRAAVHLQSLLGTAQKPNRKLVTVSTPKKKTCLVCHVIFPSGESNVVLVRGRERGGKYCHFEMLRKTIGAVERALGVQTGRASGTCLLRPTGNDSDVADVR